MNGPVPYLKGKLSECHRVRNAKRPREGSNSRTVSNYYIDRTNTTAIQLHGQNCVILLYNTKSLSSSAEGYIGKMPYD